jgi:hypothetical protein
MRSALTCAARLELHGLRVKNIAPVALVRRAILVGAESGSRAVDVRMA